MKTLLRVAALAVGLLSVEVQAAPINRTRMGPTRGFTNRAPLEALVAGAGMPATVTPAQFYSAFSAQFTGNWGLFSGGDGSSQAGGLTWSASGSPTTQTLATCGNGPDCASLTSRRYTAATMFDNTTAQAPTQGHFSIVAMVKPDLFNGSHDVFAQYGGGGNYWILRISGAGQVQLYIADAATALTVVTADTITPRAWNAIACTYQRVGGAGDNIVTCNVNGVVTTSSAMGLMKTTGTQGIYVGIREGVSNPYTGNVAVFGYSEANWSAATRAAMVNALLPTLSTSTGATIPSGRASPVSCSNDNWATFTTVANGRPCPAGYGVEEAPQATNLALWARAFDNVAWVDKAGVTVTANTADVTAPDGSNTAEKLVATGVNRTFQDPTGANGAYTAQVWGRAAAGGQSIVVAVKDRATDVVQGTNTCALSTSAWVRCTATGTTAGASTGARIDIQMPAAGTYYLYQGGIETGSVATPPIDTEASTVTRVLTNYNLSVPGYRVNLHAFSEAVGSWGRLTGVTVTSDAIASPTGTVTADKLVEDGLLSDHVIDNNSIATVIGAPYTQTVRLKAAERTWAYLVKAGGAVERAWINLSTCALASETVAADASFAFSSLADGWCLATVVWGPTSITTTGHFFGVGLATGDAVNNYTGTAGSGIYVWGMHVEAGAAVGASYIPTSSSTGKALSDLEGCAAATVHTHHAISSARVIGFGGGGITTGSNTAVWLFDGTTNASVGVASGLEGRTIPVYGQWFGSSLRVDADTSQGGVVAYDGTMAGLSSTTHLGSATAASNVNSARISNVRQDPSRNGCR